MTRYGAQLGPDPFLLPRTHDPVGPLLEGR